MSKDLRIAARIKDILAREGAEEITTETMIDELCALRDELQGVPDQPPLPQAATNKTLKERLREWTEIDVAAYQLAICLGLMTDKDAFATDVKHVFWSANEVGDGLYYALRRLEDAFILERNEDYQVRWNPKFQGDWERAFPNIPKLYEEDDEEE